MSKYISEFADINGKEYKIEIQTESGNQTKTFILGGSPFVTSMNCDGKTIYTPIKTTGATITMVTETLPFDIYSGEATGTKLTVTSGTEVVFVGFVTPCAYTQGFDEEREEIEVEAVDGISALKDIPYSFAIFDTAATFKDIILNCLKKVGIYKKLYVTDNVQLVQNGTESIIDKFRVSEANFFDEKKDRSQEDSDVAWNSYDVLFEICQYLGYTLFAQGENVYIIDLDAIKKGNNKYFVYDIASGNKQNAMTEIKYSHAIDADSYAVNGTTVSLDDVYNKVSVKDDFNTYEDIFPAFGDSANETNITADTDADLANYYLNDTYKNNYFECDTFTETNGNHTVKYQIMVAKSWKGRYWLLVWQFYDSNVFDFLKYNYTTNQRLTADTYYNSGKFSRFFNTKGAYYVKLFKKEIKGDKFNEWHVNHPYVWKSWSEEQRKKEWAKLLNTDDPTKCNYTPMIIMTNGKNGHIGPAAYNTTRSYAVTDNEDCRKYPYVRLKSGQSSAIFGGANAYIIIKATFRSHDEWITPFPMADGGDNGDLKREPDWKYNDQFFNWARLKWGDRYWTGDGWSSTPTDFKLWFISNHDEGEKTRVKDYYDKDFDVLDTARADFGCSEKGYYIPAPTDGNLEGEAEFVLYCPRDWWGRSNHGHWNDNNRYSRYYNYVQIVKNLSIKAHINNGLLDEKETDSATVYTNIIENGSVKKADEIKFKICTNDNKKPTYSAVDYESNGKSVYVVKTYNKANHTAEINSNSISSYDNKQLLTQEEHLIFKLVSQYETPKVVFECSLKSADNHQLYGTYTDKTLSGKTFICDKIETDYKQGIAKMKLIEKW